MFFQRELPFSIDRRLIAALLVTMMLAPAGCSWIELVSSDNAGNPSDSAINKDSNISDNGRFVAFLSLGSNLPDAPPTGGEWPEYRTPVYLRDTQLNSTTLIQQDVNHVWGGLTLSGNGQYIAFGSTISLLPEDTDSDVDLYLRNISTGELILVPEISARGWSYEKLQPAMSTDGRYTAYTDYNLGNRKNVVLFDRVTGAVSSLNVDSLGNPGNGEASDPAISSDGSCVVFRSDSTNLVPNDTNGQLDIFLHERASAKTFRVSLASGGAQATGGPSLWADVSNDCRIVVFSSHATNLVSGDTNGAADIFVHYRLTGLTGRVSLDSDGNEGNSHSRWVLGLSGDGRFALFGSEASNLVPDDSNGEVDIFIRDIFRNRTSRVSVGMHGQQGNDQSTRSSLSDDGRNVTFTTYASNLLEIHGINSENQILLRSVPQVSISGVFPQLLPRGATPPRSRYPVPISCPAPRRPSPAPRCKTSPASMRKPCVWTSVYPRARAQGRGTSL